MTEYARGYRDGYRDRSEYMPPRYTEWFIPACSKCGMFLGGNYVCSDSKCPLT